MKRFAAIGIPVLIVGIAVVACRESGGQVEFVSYDTAILKMPGVPGWNPTNEIPLAPDKAVKAAITYANNRHGTNVQWDVDNLSIKKYSADTAWFYTIDLVDRTSGRYSFEQIRVLLNGQVWEASSKK